jgi:hypothetical protein
VTACNEADGNTDVWFWGLELLGGSGLTEVAETPPIKLFYQTFFKTASTPPIKQRYTKQDLKHHPSHVVPPIWPPPSYTYGDPGHKSHMEQPKLIVNVVSTRPTLDRADPDRPLWNS